MTFFVIALGMMMVFLGLAFFAPSGGSAASRRLGRLRRGGVATPTEEDSIALLKGRNARRFRERLTEMVAVVGRTRGEREVYAKIRRRLVEAGFRGPNALAIYMGSRIALAVSCSLLSVVLFGSFGARPQLVTILLPAMVGYVIPGIVVDRTRKARQESIERGLADAIDLMVICIEAGLGLRATLERVGHELRTREPVIASEFRSAVAETDAGRGLLTALRSMADRTGNQELEQLVSLLIQTDRFGTPVSQSLRLQGDAIRFSRMQRAEETAQKAPLKMLAPSMLIFVAILVIMLGPAMMTIGASLSGAGR